MTIIPQATLVFANHRPETVSGQRMRMHGFKTILLEEPTDTEFVPMMLDADRPVNALRDMGKAFV